MLRWTSSLTLVVLGSGVHILLAVAQHREMIRASLCAVAVMALGDPKCDFFRRRKDSRALSERCSAFAASRRALAARLALALVLELITFPPRPRERRLGNKTAVVRRRSCRRPGESGSESGGSPPLVAPMRTPRPGATMPPCGLRRTSGLASSGGRKSV